MSETDRIKALELLSEIESRKKREAAQKDFLEFVKVMWPEFIHGSHHAKMARAFERVAKGELKRLIVCLAPRHTKSEFASYLLPAWYLGLHPNRQIMQLSHTADLAEGFGRKVRNLVDSDLYHTIFPDTRLRRDSTAAARWNTDKNGVYIAMGVGGAVAGKGADLCVKVGSLVKTHKGYTPIEQIEVGDLVLAEEGYVTVLHTLTSESSIETRINGEYTFTPNHPIWTKNRGWVPAEEVKPGDILTMTPLRVIIKSYTQMWRLQWLKVKQVLHHNVNTIFGR
jgi:hypothetical protein